MTGNPRRMRGAGGKRPAVIPLPRRGREGAQARRPAVRRVRIDPYRLAVAIAVIYFIVTAISQELVLTDLNRQLGSLESELETVRAQQAVLRQRLAYLQSDSYIVQEARGRFGMAHPGEIRYVIVDEPQPEEPPAAASQRQSDAHSDAGAAAAERP